ncbi:MAG: hypothetical protein AAF193_11080, partial [Bacteroidota bacterium]
MKQVLLIILAISMTFGCGTASTPNSGTEPSKSSSNQMVDDLLAKMTLEEKIGQMTQLTLDMICVGAPYALEEPHRVDEDKLS